MKSIKELDYMCRLRNWSINVRSGQLRGYHTFDYRLDGYIPK